MDVYEAIKTRRSVRKFLKKEISRDVLTKILDAGRLAPSAGNLQNWKFISVLKHPIKKALAEACLQQYWMEEADVIIVILGEPDKAKRFYGMRGERLYTIQNTAAAAQNMILTAHSLGVGTCWIGSFDEDRVASIVGIPEEWRPQVVIALGYPAESPEPQTKYPLEILAYWNKWRTRIEDIDSYLGFHSTKIEHGMNKVRELVDKGVEHVSKRGKELVDKLGKPQNK